MTLLASWRFTRPEDNVNWVYSYREEIRSPRARAGFVALLMIGIPLLCLLPAHLLLKHLFRLTQTRFILNIAHRGARAFARLDSICSE
jgi:hypothetical protein